MNIQVLIDIEEILLKADNDIKFTYSLDELIKSEKYLKEIGFITDLYFKAQLDFSKINTNEQALKEYHDKLISDEIDVDVSNYITFIMSIGSRLRDKDYFDKVKKLLGSFKPQ